MRDKVQKLRRELVGELTAGEALAIECEGLARLNEQQGNSPFAETLRGLGRSHRIRQLETEGKLALLQHRHGHLLT